MLDLEFELLGNHNELNDINREKKILEYKLKESERIIKEVESKQGTTSNENEKE